MEADSVADGPDVGADTRAFRSGDADALGLQPELVLNIDNPEGPFGIGRECPGEVASEPFDNCTNTTSGADRSKILACSCQLIFTRNFVRTYNNRGSGSDEQPHIGGNCLTFANWWGNASKDNYTELPAAAKQIIAEAGPRPKTPKRRSDAVKSR